MLVSAMALALVFTSPLAGWRTSAQSPACEINQITFTPWGDSYAPAISGDGTRLAFLSDGDLSGANADRTAEVFLYGTQAGFTQITNTTHIPVVLINSEVISADGSRIAFSSLQDLTGGNPDGGQEIFLYDIRTASLTQVTNTSEIFGFPGLAINYDGSRLAFLSYLDVTGDNPDVNEEVFLYDSTTGDISQITFTTGGFHKNLEMSADGTRLAFASNLDPTGGNPERNAEIFLYNIPTASYTQVTDTTESGFAFVEVALSDDGSRIAFPSSHNLTGQNVDRNPEIFFYDAQTLGITQVTNTTGLVTLGSPPAISGDGTRIAFSSTADLTGGNSDGNRELFLYDIPARGLSQVTDTTSGYSNFPAINADGTRIAFLSTADLTGSNSDGNSEVFLATCPIDRDSDDDGIPNDTDPDTVADVVIALPDTEFHSLGNRNALLSRLEAIEQLILAGNTDTAIQELQGLRRRVDGCGTEADTNDWITDCSSQLQVRALIDLLIANLSS
jgi:Tol biopolymer transport system component